MTPTTTTRPIPARIWPRMVERRGPGIEQAVVSRDDKAVHIDPRHPAWREGFRQQFEAMRQQAKPAGADQPPEPQPVEPRAPILRTIVKHEIHPAQRHIADKLAAMAKRDAHRVKPPVTTTKVIGRMTPDGIRPIAAPGNAPAKPPQPRTYTADQIALAEARAKICEACDQVKRVTRTRGEHQLYRVGCKQCGCGGLSLVEGKCPAGKWLAIDDQLAAKRRANGKQMGAAKLVDLFDRVVVINLDRRPDRWEQFQQRLPKDWPFKQPQRVRAVDGRVVGKPPWWGAGGGAWGVYATHLRILEDVIMDGVESVLILEDDAMCVEGFADRCRDLMAHLPSDWHHLYLGGQHLKVKNHPPQPVNDHFVRCYNVNRCHAHALRGDYIKAAYRHLLRYKQLARQHLSKQGKAHHLDHHLGQLHETGRWNIYAPSEWLIGQAEGKSDICAKDLPPRFWQRGGPRPHQRQRRPVLVIGHPRSGTSYTAKLLQAHGLDVGHERVGRDGIVSWMFAVDANKVPWGDGSIRRMFEFDKIIHVVRHPLNVLASSMQTEHQKSLEFRRWWAKPPAGLNPHEEAVHILLAWERLCLDQKPVATVRAETAADELPRLLGLPAPVKPLPATNVNTRKHEPLTWADLQAKLRPDLIQQLETYAAHYGYDLENPDAMPRPQQAS